MGDPWRMTVADRRWWIGQPHFIRQNEAQGAASTAQPGQGPEHQQDPNATQSAREMLRNYHNISS